MQVTLGKNQRIYLPKEVIDDCAARQSRAIAATFSFCGMDLELRANVVGHLTKPEGSKAYGRPQVFISFPEPLFKLIQTPLPQTLQVDFVGTDHVAKDTQRATPLGDLVKFRAVVYMDGGAFTIAIPSLWHDGLIRSPEWSTVDITLHGPNGPLGSFSSALNYRKVLYVPRDRCVVSNEQSVLVELRTTRKITHSNSGNEFDWTHFQSDKAVWQPTVDDQRVVVHSQRSHATIKVNSPLVETCWFLGVYLAEGSKSATAFEASIPNKCPQLLKRCADFLRDWGYDKLVVDIRYNSDMYEEDYAVDLYKNVAMVGCVNSNGALNNVKCEAVLRLRESRTILDTFRLALSWLTDKEGIYKLPVAARWAFLLGYLDGDGSFTVATTDVIRLSSGNEPEAGAIQKLMWQLLKLKEQNTSKPIEIDYRTTLTLFDEIELIIRGAFSYSESRPRLFHVAYEKIDKAMRNKQGPYARWGWIDENGVSPKLQDAIDRLKAFDDEWTYIQSIFPDLASTIGNPGEKGRLYFYDKTERQTPRIDSGLTRAREE